MQRGLSQWRVRLPIGTPTHVKTARFFLFRICRNFACLLDPNTPIIGKRMPNLRVGCEIQLINFRPISVTDLFSYLIRYFNQVEHRVFHDLGENNHNMLYTIDAKLLECLPIAELPISLRPLILGIVKKNVAQIFTTHFPGAFQLGERWRSWFHKFIAYHITKPTPEDVFGLHFWEFLQQQILDVLIQDKGVINFGVKDLVH